MFEFMQWTVLRGWELDFGFPIAAVPPLKAGLEMAVSDLARSGAFICLFILFSFFHKYYLCLHTGRSVSVCVCACHDMHVKVRKELCGIVFFHVSGLGSKYFIC